MINFLNLREANLSLADELEQVFRRVLTSGNFILGQEVSSFEREFSQFCETSYSVGVSNGYDALVLSLRALGVGPGDEVIVPGQTFVATWLAVTAVGANIIPADIELDCFGICPKEVEKKITSKTKAIIAVHLFGLPCQIKTLKEISDKRRVFLIEDAAQAHGAMVEGKSVGGFGNVSAFSFYPGKNLGALGDGGIVTTNCEKIRDRILLYRNYGSGEKYRHDLIGFNARLDELQAAFLRVKLSHLLKWNSRRTEISNMYMERLENSVYRLPKVEKSNIPSWHIFPVLAKNRNIVREKLANAGIETLIHYPVPPFLQPCYEFLGKSNDLLNSKQLANEEISLPMCPFMGDSEVEKVIDVLLAEQ